METQNKLTFKIFIFELLVYTGLVAVYFYLNAGLWAPLFNDILPHLPSIQLYALGQDINGQVAIVLTLLVLAVALFALERISVDIVTLGLLVVLMVTGILTPREAFYGFSNEIIIILASIFVIGSALQRTGIMDVVGNYLLKMSGKRVKQLMLVAMSAVGGMSMFMNNTTATVIFISPVMYLARALKTSPSKLLMPLAYASILGGTATLIGTSTNVAVSGYMAQLGFEPVGLFELMPVGLILLGVGMLYLVTVGKYLLPGYKDDNLADDYAIREYLSEVAVRSDSELVGQRIFESDLAQLDFTILGVIRDDKKFRPNIRSRIEAGDIFLVQGQVDHLMQVKETVGIDIKPELAWDDSVWQQNGDIEAFRLAELLVTPQSDLIGRTLKSSNFMQNYNAGVLAIYRQGHSLYDKLNRIRLRMGDLLLVQSPEENLEFLQGHSDFWLLDTLQPTLHRKRKGLLTLSFLIGAVIVGGLGWLPLSVAFLIAAVLVLLFHCITIEEAYEFVDWRLIILIGGMTAFGLAMEKTGTAEFLANTIVVLLEPFGIIAIMAGFLVLTVLLTQPMSNAAAALVILPVALHTAQNLQANGRTFAIAIMLAASISLITPFEPSCLLVYGPGKYKFRDFVKVGGGLTFLLLVLVLILVPLFWPL